MPIVRTLLFYAALLLAGGIVAVLLAPDPSRAVTAVIVTGACAVLVVLCALLARRLPKSKAQGMIGIHLGLLLPVLFAIVFIQRGIAIHRDVLDHREQRAAFSEFVLEDVEPDTDDAFRDWLIRNKFREAYEAGTIDEAVSVDAFRTQNEFRRLRRVNDHDKSYLRLVLFTLAGISAAMFVVMLRQRPKPSERAKPDAAD